MIKSKFILIVFFVLFGLLKYTWAADVSILDLNLRAHETLSKNIEDTDKKGKKILRLKTTKEIEDSGGAKFVRHIKKRQYDFITTQEGDDSTFKLTELDNMKNIYGIDKTGRIYFKKADWDFVKSTKFKELTPDQLFSGKEITGAGSRFASLAVFKSKKLASKDRYITIVSTHYCIDWYWKDSSGKKNGSKGCAVDNSTSNIQKLKKNINEQVAINIDDYIQQAEKIAGSLTVEILGKDLGIEKPVDLQIIAHVSDSIKIAETIKNYAPADSAVFFAGDLNNQYVSNPDDIENDVKNPEKIKLAIIEATAVEKALEAKGLTQTKFDVSPTFEGGPVIDFAYYRGLVPVSANIYARNNAADGDGQNTSDHDGMQLDYDFVPLSNTNALR
ncbi:MAG TPA: hypothetical protein VKR58_13220 [Aquella sp.]|nr:hypothetical protein [Aquella sp.]